MIRQTSSCESGFSEYVSLLLELHRLTVGDQGDTEEADDLRDRMDAPWRRLNGGEAKLVDGLSVDLYSLGVDRDGPDAFTGEPDEFARFQQAVEENQWPTVLEVVRNVEEHLPSHTVAFLRGVCWAQMHEPNAAILFLREAARLQPQTPEEEVWLLGCFTEAGRAREALDRSRELLESSTEPLLLLQASLVLFSAACELNDEAAEALLREAIDAANRSLAAADKAPSDDLLKTMQASVLLHLAIAHDMQGNTETAVEACVRAIQVDPARPIALELLGFLSYRGFPAAQRASFRNRLSRQLISEPQRCTSTAMVEFN